MKYAYTEWQFIERVGDIRDIKITELENSNILTPLDFERFKVNGFDPLTNKHMAKNKTITVKSFEIVLYSQNNKDFISLTDMARYRDAARTNYIIQNWLRTRNDIEFCGLWEQINNPAFKRIEFDAFKNQAGANSFALTPQKWIETTNAVGVISKSGRYGGTFAHRDIAFEFA